MRLHFLTSIMKMAAIHDPFYQDGTHITNDVIGTTGKFQKLNHLKKYTQTKRD